jgi:hypothetical protein
MGYRESDVPIVAMKFRPMNPGNRGRIKPKPAKGHYPIENWHD